MNDIVVCRYVKDENGVYQPVVYDSEGAVAWTVRDPNIFTPIPVPGGTPEEPV